MNLNLSDPAFLAALKTGAPIITYQSTSNQFSGLNEANQIDLYARAQGAGALTYAWKRDGVTIQSGSYTAGEVCILSTYPYLGTHTYVCTFTGPGGSATTQDIIITAAAELTVVAGGTSFGAVVAEIPLNGEYPFGGWSTLLF